MIITGPDVEHPVHPSTLLQCGLVSRPDEEALVSAETRWTWRKLDETSSRLGARYLALGLVPGDRVASLMPNRTWLVIHYLACFKTGLVATPLNYRYTPPEIDHALAVSGASMILAHAERGADLAACARVADLPLGIVHYGATDGRSPSLEELISGTGGSTPEFPLPDPSLPAAIFFTSGSTGRPKGVTHTFDTLGWMFASVRSAFKFQARDITLPGSSMSHLGSFLFGLGSLAAGARVVVARTFDGDELIPLLRRERPTVLAMLPAALIALVRDHNATHELFSSLRLCRAGGDKVSAELEKEFTDIAGLPIDEGYGMTEVGLATLNPPDGEIRIGSVGRPIPGFALSIRDEDGREVSLEEDGRVWIRSRSSTVGYWNNPDATAEIYRDGWLDSGDVMRADSEGYFWFRGRKKQIIVHDSSNICPQEVEEALSDHPAVGLAGVVGIHDLMHGENVRAYITLNEGAAFPGAQELIRFARERVGYKAPEEIFVLDAMPMTPTGKVNRTRLKQMAEDRHEGETIR